MFPKTIGRILTTIIFLVTLMFILMSIFTSFPGEMDGRPRPLGVLFPFIGLLMVVYMVRKNS